MISSYRLVVFDWEGTLGDTLGQIFHTVAEEAKRLNYGELDENLARQYVDLGLNMAVKKTFPHLSLTQYEKLLEAVQHSLSTRSSEVYIIPGAEKFIQGLQQQGVNLAIATNKSHQSLQRTLQTCGFDQFFQITRCAGQIPPKPCPQMLQEIMDVFAVNASETLMIGDSVTDIEMANNIGVDAIGVDFYHQQKIALQEAGAKKVFDSYEELANYLQLAN